MSIYLSLNYRQTNFLINRKNPLELLESALNLNFNNKQHNDFIKLYDSVFASLTTLFSNSYNIKSNHNNYTIQSTSSKQTTANYLQRIHKIFSGSSTDNSSNLSTNNSAAATIPISQGSSGSGSSNNLRQPSKAKVVICFQQGERHTIEKQNKGNSDLNLREMMSLSKDITNLPKAIVFEDIEKPKTNNSQSDTKRCRIFNNNFFSHIEDLKYSSFSNLKNANQEHISTRLKNLSYQVKFAAKYRCLTFKLCLLAFKNQQLVVCKGKTVTQGSYFKVDDAALPRPNRLNRSTDAQSTDDKVKKFNDECHISCIPNVFDNAKFEKPFNEDISSFETNFEKNSDLNIKDFVKTELQINDKPEDISLFYKLYSLALKDPSINFKEEKIITENFPDFFTNLRTNNKTYNFVSKLIKSKKQEPLNIPNNTLLFKYVELVDEQIKTQEKITSMPKDSEDLRALRNKLNELKNKIEKFNLDSIHMELKLFIIKNFDDLKDFFKINFDKNFQLLQLFHSWVQSNLTPRERLMQTLSKLASSESIIPLNSVLGMMLSATLAMPSEINHGIDAKTDETHSTVAELLTEFSRILNPTDNDFNTFMNKYINLLKETYDEYKNTKNDSKNAFQTLEKAIKQYDVKSTMEEFINKNEALIADYYFRHVADSEDKYDEDFEKLVMGKVIESPLLITRPVVDFQPCTDCKITITPKAS